MLSETAIVNVVLDRVNTTGYKGVDHQRRTTMEVALILAGALALVYGPGLAGHLKMIHNHKQWLEA